MVETTKPRITHDNFYEYLGLDKKPVDYEKAHKAYRKFAQKYHPDNRSTGNAEKFKNATDAIAFAKEKQDEIWGNKKREQQVDFNVYYSTFMRRPTETYGMRNSNIHIIDARSLAKRTKYNEAEKKYILGSLDMPYSEGKLVIREAYGMWVKAAEDASNAREYAAARGYVQRGIALAKQNHDGEYESKLKRALKEVRDWQLENENPLLYKIVSFFERNSNKNRFVHASH